MDTPCACDAFTLTISVTGHEDMMYELWFYKGAPFLKPVYMLRSDSPVRMSDTTISLYLKEFERTLIGWSELAGDNDEHIDIGVCLKKNMKVVNNVLFYDCDAVVEAVQYIKNVLLSFKSGDYTTL